MSKTFKDIMFEQGKEYAREGISLEHLGELNDNQDFLMGYNEELENMKNENINERHYRQKVSNYLEKREIKFIDICREKKIRKKKK